jgi:glycosyltransferase involved in cell wall biosynthesis
VGQVPDAYEFMSQHSIMIVPLLAGGGMRIKILEGLSYGKVIVSTSIGAEGIPAENGKEICIADTSNEFVSAIQAIILQPETIDEISQNAQNFITRCFDNSLIIKNLIEFYQKN